MYIFIIVYKYLLIHICIGHSERRCVFKDDDNAISRKVKKVITQGMTAVLCFGETQEEYEVNK